MKQLSDWTIVGVLSCGIGICGVSIAGAGGINGRIGVGVLGSTTGAIIGTYVVKSGQSREAQAEALPPNKSTTKSFLSDEFCIALSTMSTGFCAL